jgi:hypothetical protein
MPKRTLEMLDPLPHNFQSLPGPSSWTKRVKSENEKDDQDSDSDDDEIGNNADVYDEAISAVAEGY